MLRLSSDRVEYRIDVGHRILELCSLVVHHDVSPEAANVVEISRPGGCENLHPGLLRQLHRIRTDIPRPSVDFLDLFPAIILGSLMEKRSHRSGRRRSAFRSSPRL